MQEKNKILFVGGRGRSGSTLLESLLGEVEGICSIGEVRAFFRRRDAPRRYCGCGTEISQCSFWNNVLEEAFPSGSGFNYHEAQDVYGAIAWEKRVPLLTAPVKPPGLQEKIDYILSVFDRFYAAVATVSGCEVIVDSSKNAGHGALLSQSETIDLRMLHLVRDSRAVANSWTRKKRVKAVHWKEEYLQRLPVGKSSLIWNLSNVMSSYLTRYSDRHLRLKYESFVADPVAAIEAVMDLIDFDRARASVVQSGAFDFSGQHALCGNPMLWASDGPVTIKADEKWRDEMSTRDQATAYLLTLPVRKMMGYS